MVEYLPIYICMYVCMDGWMDGYEIETKLPKSEEDILSSLNRLRHWTIEYSLLM
jgi:Ser/Thr protein kinase RdoA (MazF antagonist)